MPAAWNGPEPAPQQLRLLASLVTDERADSQASGLLLELSEPGDAVQEERNAHGRAGEPLRQAAREIR